MAGEMNYAELMKLTDEDKKGLLYGSLLSAIIGAGATATRGGKWNEAILRGLQAGSTGYIQGESNLMKYKEQITQATQQQERDRMQRENLESRKELLQQRAGAIEAERARKETMKAEELGGWNTQLQSIVGRQIPEEQLPKTSEQAKYWAEKAWEKMNIKQPEVKEYRIRDAEGKERLVPEGELRAGVQGYTNPPAPKDLQNPIPAIQSNMRMVNSYYENMKKQIDAMTTTEEYKTAGEGMIWKNPMDTKTKVDTLTANLEQWLNDEQDKVSKDPKYIPRRPTLQSLFNRGKPTGAGKEYITQSEYKALIGNGYSPAEIKQRYMVR